MVTGLLFALAATVLNSVAGLLESDATRHLARGRVLLTQPRYLGGLVVDLVADLVELFLIDDGPDAIRHLARVADVGANDPGGAQGYEHRSGPQRIPIRVGRGWLGRPT